MTDDNAGTLASKGDIFNGLAFVFTPIVEWQSTGFQALGPSRAIGIIICALTMVVAGMEPRLVRPWRTWIPRKAEQNGRMILSYRPARVTLDDLSASRVWFCELRLPLKNVFLNRV